MEFHFNKDTLSDFTANVHREWPITNGIGGYAGSSVLGAHNRTHQGYLIASYHPPVERYMVFSKTNETIEQADTTWDLTTGQYAGEPISRTVVSGEDVPEEYKRSDTVNVESDFVPRRPVYRTGNQFLADFCYDGNVHFTYQVGEERFTVSTAQLQEILDGVPLNTPQVMEFIRGYIKENMDLLSGGAT